MLKLNRYLWNTPAADFASLANAAASPDVAGLMQSLLTEEGAIPEPVYREALTETRPALQAAYAGWFASNEVVAAIYPTTPLPAAPIGHDETVELNGEQVPTFPTFIRNSAPSSLAGIPGVTLPAGLSADGLPIGMELDGPAGSDRVLLSLSAAVEAILPATPARPLNRRPAINPSAGRRDRNPNRGKLCQNPNDIAPPLRSRALGRRGSCPRHSEPAGQPPAS